jgi:hypothetical protein
VPPGATFEVADADHKLAAVGVDQVARLAQWTRGSDEARAVGAANRRPALGSLSARLRIGEKHGVYAKLRPRL